MTLTPEQQRNASVAITNAVLAAAQTGNQLLQQWAATMADKSLHEVFPDVVVSETTSVSQTPEILSATAEGKTVVTKAKRGRKPKV